VANTISRWCACLPDRHRQIHGPPLIAIQAFSYNAVLTSGKQHTSRHAKAPLKRLLDELGPHQPALVRGDCGYGNQDIIDICEKRELPYRLRLCQTDNVKRLIERLFRREDWSRASDASQGWQAIEDSIKLSGWSEARRVVVLRRRIKHDIAVTAKRDDGQKVLALPHDSLEHMRSCGNTPYS